ncbi:hypothetical protein J437_LFUL012779 [Ladona fulva]|uniref:Organic cation transporter protein n=1 Tax=Ladona fulva TaxID=123851 RepID=A0A8K0KDW3_LADFU|nr:hypothetical protein J437_LFUL012779 [Ladona fulva]
MGYDDVLEHLGEFGRYQKRVYFLLCIPTISCALHKLASVFLGAQVNHRCKLPFESDNATYDLGGKFNMTIPWDGVRNEPASCLRFDTNFSSEYFEEGIPANKTAHCEHWVYDTSKYQSSAVMERDMWDMVCENAWLRATADSIFMVGVLLGSLIFGDLSDRIIPESVRWLLTKGRIEEVKKLLSKAAKENKVEIPESVINGLVEEKIEKKDEKVKQHSLFDLFKHPNLRKKSFFIFFNWFGRRPTFFISLVLQVIGGLLAAVAPGYVLFVIARMLVGATTSGVFLVAYVIGVEMVGPSARLFTGVFCQYFFSLGFVLTALFSYFVRDWRMLQVTLTVPGILFFSYWWMVISGSYYGLSWSTSNLGGNDYLNFLISGAVEVPGYTFTLLTLNVWGRKYPLCGSMLVGGVVLLLTIAVPHGLDGPTFFVSLVLQVILTKI